MRALVKTLSSKNPTTGGAFGFSVATDDTKILIVAPNENVKFTRTITINSAGNSYVLAASGRYVKTLSSLNPDGGEYFGYSVAMSGGNFVVDAPSENVDGAPQYVDAGHAYYETKSLATVTHAYFHLHIPILI